MKAVLVRHTRTEGKVGICYGRSDVPVTGNFHVEAREIESALPWSPRQIWSSPSERCRKLARFLAGGLDLEVRIDERLAELDFGDWEGKAWPGPHDAQARRWYDSPWTERPPNGEKAEELCARVAAFREELLASHSDHVVIVTHAGVIRAWKSLALRRPLADVFAQRVEYGEIFPAE